MRRTKLEEEEEEEEELKRLYSLQHAGLTR